MDASVGVQVQRYPMFARFVAVGSVVHKATGKRVDRPRQPIFGYEVARDQFGVGGPSLGA